MHEKALAITNLKSFVWCNLREFGRKKFSIDTTHDNCVGGESGRECLLDKERERERGRESEKDRDTCNEMKSRLVHDV